MRRRIDVFIILMNINFLIYKFKCLPILTKVIRLPTQNRSLKVNTMINIMSSNDKMVYFANHNSDLFES